MSITTRVITSFLSNMKQDKSLFQQIGGQYLSQPPGVIVSNFNTQVGMLYTKLRSWIVVDVTVQIEHSRFEGQDGAVRLRRLLV